ncbi:hypothetical protein [Streptomyces sp. NBC_00483]|uniref:hypothetical protein n=1 Tax=Streptomyces sp. NBC_00483 TaxID=2975756 RepID=UPI002E196224
MSHKEPAGEPRPPRPEPDPDGADLYDVRVRDPALPGARIRCPGGRDRVRLLTGLHSVRCTATGAARPGTWIGKADATGRQAYLRATARASARSGYAGVGAALALAETVRVAGPGRVLVRYAVTNTGNRPVHDVRLTDPALTAATDRIDCVAGRPVVARLAPRESAWTRQVRKRAGGSASSIACWLAGSRRHRPAGARSCRPAAPVRWWDIPRAVMLALCQFVPGRGGRSCRGWALPWCTTRGPSRSGTGG